MFAAATLKVLSLRGVDVDGVDGFIKGVTPGTPDSQLEIILQTSEP